jgi:Ca2+-binding RTX toxin-like protein
MATIVGTLGSDVLTGTPHDDLIVGDRLLYVFPFDTDPSLGSDTIRGGAGNDTIIGDIQTYVGLLDSFADFSFPLLPNFFTGNALLSGGAGNDHIAGVFGSFSLTFSGITVDFGGGVPAGDPSTLPPINHIYGDAGDDTIAGGSFSTSVFLINGADISNLFQEHFPAYIDGGNGSDLITGNCQNFLVDAKDGSTWDNLVVSFDSNTIIGGNGKDTLYGNTLTYTLTAENNSHYIDHQIIYRGDQIDGGNGKDTIYGDAGTLFLNIDHTSSLTANILLGGDHITGGNGDDVLWGDIAHVDLTGVSLADFNSFINLSSKGDVINGGNGKDFIAGEWGDDLLTGGLGKDTFAYFAEISNGHDTITDFNPKIDILLGNSPHMFSDGGHDVHGNLIVNVADAGVNSTITMLGVQHFADLHIQMSNTHVVTVHP